MALDYSVIGSRIKQARLAKNMTQEDLADQIDISVTEGYLLNGASSSSQNYLDKEFTDLIKSVSPAKQKLIYNVAKTIAETETDEEE